MDQDDGFVLEPFPLYQTSNQPSTVFLVISIQFTVFYECLLSSICDVNSRPTSLLSINNNNNNKAGQGEGGKIPIETLIAPLTSEVDGLPGCAH